MEGFVSQGLFAFRLWRNSPRFMTNFYQIMKQILTNFNWGRRHGAKRPGTANKAEASPRNRPIERVFLFNRKLTPTTLGCPDIQQLEEKARACTLGYLPRGTWTKRNATGVCL
jgi:hypothetical protein